MTHFSHEKNNKKFFIDINFNGHFEFKLISPFSHEKKLFSNTINLILAENLLPETG